MSQVTLTLHLSYFKSTVLAGPKERWQLSLAPNGGKGSSVQAMLL